MEGSGEICDSAQCQPSAGPQARAATHHCATDARGRALLGFEYGGAHPLERSGSKLVALEVDETAHVRENVVPHVLDGRLARHFSQVGDDVASVRRWVHVADEQV